MGTLTLCPSYCYHTAPVGWAKRQRAHQFQNKPVNHSPASIPSNNSAETHQDEEYTPRFTNFLKDE